MDFYNLQESDHRLIAQAMSRASSDLLSFDRVLNKKNILLAEEDPRIQRAMQKLILEINRDAQCWIVDSVEEITDMLEQQECDLLIANYYLSEDEIDYEFWEAIRERFPRMEVLILSHINDREYYEMLEKISQADQEGSRQPLSSRIKHFFEHVFGG